MVVMITLTSSVIVHQDYQEQINEMVASIEQKDLRITKVMHVCNHRLPTSHPQVLREAETVLSEYVEEGRRQLKIREQARAAAPDVADLVSYSHRISSTTSAPMGWQEGSWCHLSLV